MKEKRIGKAAESRSGNKDVEGSVCTTLPSLTLLLDAIDSSADLKTLGVGQLPQLAAEIRDRITTVVSQNGGHLAPSLGAVELAIALHYVLDTPEDKVVWDVGHQAYAHKLLTGRRKAFGTLRQYGGISGFLKREESPYDSFGAGHASTSISAAFGMACARDLKRENHKVVAVIGDGALTGGLAFEGINNAGASGKDLIVVLNDNKMSISPNVGALSRYYTDIISTRLYNRIKKDIWALTGHLAAIGGEHVRRAMRRIDQSVKALIVPGLFFERLGFRYFGPIDGHDVAHLIEILEGIKELQGPILLHLSTTKGKGCAFAEENAAKFHGIGAFEKMTGEVEAKKCPSYSEVFGRSLTEFAETREDVVAITAAMTDGTGLTCFGQRYPDRLFDVGIAEGHAVTFAAGLAAEGLRPVVAIYSTFLQRAFDHIIHDVALQGLPVIFAVDRAGLVGDDGPTHHGTFDLSYLRFIPNMVVMAPKDERELKAMLKTALAYDRGPIALRYPRGSGPGVDCEGEVEVLEIGQSEILREGDDGAILAVGAMVSSALEAAEILAQQHISLEVVNVRFVKPLDQQMVRRIAEAGKPMITVEENALEGGFGSAVMEYLEQAGIEASVKRLGIPDHFIEHGDQTILMRGIGLDVAGMVQAIGPFIRRPGI
ncbi:MAG: 1-deoxy-D-xylulose-5-phosphate synthase [Candidatus Latescibacterota bacterium]